MPPTDDRPYLYIPTRAPSLLEIIPDPIGHYPWTESWRLGHITRYVQYPYGCVNSKFQCYPRLSVSRAYAIRTGRTDSRDLLPEKQKMTHAHGYGNSGDRLRWPRIE